jgi:hypothetical protein
MEGFSSMNDDDQPAIVPAPSPADPLEVIGAMLTMINSARQCERRVREIRRETAAAVAAKAELATGHAELAAARAELASERAALESDKADIEKRRLAVHAAEGLLAERERRHAELEKAWADIGEPPEVLSGFRDAEFSALHKAKRARGLLDTDAQVGTSDTDDASDTAFRDSMPPDVSLARAAQTRPARSQRVRAEQ